MRDRKGLTALELIVGTAIVGVTLTVGYACYQGLSALNKYVNTPEVQRSNVIEGSHDEVFIERDGQRFYRDIDGKSVEDYISNRKQ